VLAYCIGQVGNTLPIPGAVSGGMVGALLAFGVQADLALTSVLAYRAAAIWLPAPAGLLALGALKRTVARWRDTQAPGCRRKTILRPAAPTVCASASSSALPLAAVAARRQRPMIARRGNEHGSASARSAEWSSGPSPGLHSFRRLRTRYERDGDLDLAFMQLRCAVICHRMLG
jgi:hypothetical protein